MSQPVFPMERVETSCGCKRAACPLFGDGEVPHGCLHSLLETVQMAAVILDTQGRVCYANPFLLQLSGRDRQELIGADWFETMLPKDDAQTLRRLFERSMAEGAIPPHGDNPILTKTGRRRLISWDNAVLRGVDGTVAGTSSLGRDITDTKSLQAQLVQAQKLEAVGRLAGGVAHDFNNLLTGILGNIELATLPGRPETSDYDPLGEIRIAALRAAELTRQLLAFSRKQVMELLSVDLNELVVNLQRMLRRLLGEDVALRASLMPQLPHVLADPGQIEQVIVNLAVNARDAMPSGGELSLRSYDQIVTAVESEAQGGLRPGRYVVVEVRDTGVGMDSETVEHIFEPFFTTKPKDKGTGLGLATALGIIEQHNGRIEVDTQPGRGSAFRVLLPVAPSGAKGQQNSLAPMPTMAGHGVVLLVEDDATVAKVAQRMLERLGYEVHTARNGKDAIALATRHAATLSLVMTDVVMPGMNGRELAEAVRSLRPDLPILFTSGYSHDVIAQHGVFNEGVHFFPKPYTVSALAQKLGEILGR